MPTLIFIPGKLPGMNEIIAAAKGMSGKGIMYSRMKHDIGTAIGRLLRHERVPHYKSAYVEFVWHEARKNRDMDNISAGKKFILDALVDAGVLDGDGWKYVKGFTDSFVHDPKHPGVEVTLQGEQ